MSTTHDPKEEASQAASSTAGGRAILFTILAVVAVFLIFVGIAVYAHFASQ